MQKKQINWTPSKLKTLVLQIVKEHFKKLKRHNPQKEENVYKSQADKDPLSRIFMERTLNTLPGNNNKKYNTKQTGDLDRHFTKEVAGCPISI